MAGENHGELWGRRQARPTARSFYPAGERLPAVAPRRAIAGQMAAAGRLVLAAVRRASVAAVANAPAAPIRHCPGGQWDSIIRGPR